jgi:hypothetical protein
VQQVKPAIPTSTHEEISSMAMEHHWHVQYLQLVQKPHNINTPCHLSGEAQSKVI